MENICRPIIFYNNFLPADKTDHNWNYCALGSFDGIQVEEAIYVEQKRNKETQDSMLEKVWKHQVGIVRDLQGTYAAQIIYAMCYSDRTKENEFWEQDALPFTFFCRMQFRGNLVKLRKSKKEVEKRLQISEKVSSWIYLTYDNSDLLIVIKAVSYVDGAGIINAMHQDVNFSFDKKELCALKNSFTVFALKQEFINQTENEDIRNKLNKDIIDKVHITIIEKKSIASELLKGYFKEELNKDLNCDHVPILGADDELFICSNIGWGDFLYLYRNKKGLFHNSSEKYHEYFAGVTTKICTKITTKYDIFPKLNSTLEEEPKQEWRNLYKNFFDNMVKQLEEKMTSSNTGKLYKELRMILNTLPKFSGEVFSDYIFFSVMKPIETIINLLQTDISGDGSYYEFIKSFNMYVQNSVKSDRHTMQIMDFNTKIYDIPVKLNAFYSVYIYKICDSLNVCENEEDEKHTYDFLVVPGATNIVNVLELYNKASTDSRLLRVEIPENRFYDPCAIMRIFSHEVAHYVGTGIRNRSFRYKCIIRGIASIYINYIRSYWNVIDEEKSTDPHMVDWKFISDRMAHNIAEMLERQQLLDYVQYHLGEDVHSASQAKKMVEYNKINFEYLSFLKSNIYETMSDIICSKLENIFQSILYEQPEKNKQVFLARIQEVSERFLVRFSVESTRVTLDTVTETLCKVYEESFADLTSICLLKLTAREHLNTLIKDCRIQKMDIEQLCDSEALYRVAVVISAMDQEPTNNVWTSDFYEPDGNLEDRKKIIDKIRILRDKMIHEELLINKEYEKSCSTTLFNKTVYSDLVYYLCKCKKDIMDKVINGSNSNQYNELLRIYQFLSDPYKNIEEQIEMMEEFIHLYKSELYEKEYRKYSGDSCYGKKTKNL